jgi:hypothetical protein
VSRTSGPRIRTIKPELWQDERLAGLGDFEHRLYIGLLTQADDEGRTSANPNLIRARVFPFDPRPPESFAPGLAALEAAALIQLYDVDGRSVLQIVSWAEDQRVDRPTPSTLPRPPIVIPRDSSRTLANVPASHAPADRTGPGPGRGPDLSSPNGAEAERPDVADLCRLLADLILANDPKAKVQPDGRRWRDAARLLLDRDGRDREQVERVIRWSQADDFWRSNVLSMPKLREKFPQLLLRMSPAAPQAHRNGHAAVVDFTKYDRAAGVRPEGAVA